MTLTHETTKQPSDACRVAIHVRRAERIRSQQKLVDELDSQLLKTIREHDEHEAPGTVQELCDYVIYDRAVLEMEKTVLNELLLRYNRDGSLKEHGVGLTT
jgi:hypothetical protein